MLFDILMGFINNNESISQQFTESCPHFKTVTEQYSKINSQSQCFLLSGFPMTDFAVYIH